MSRRPLGQAVKAYQSVIPNPATQSLALLALIPVATYGKKPIFNMLRRAAADKRWSMLTGASPQEMLQAVDQMQQDNFTGKAIPIALGALPAAVSLITNTNLGAPYWGHGSWEPYASPQTKGRMHADSIKYGKPMQKSASILGYQPHLELSTPVNRWDAASLIASNPIVQQSPYASNLGMSIVTAAPYTGAQTTLGGIYDSAVNKFQKKLQHDGLGTSVLKGAISGAMAGMFTDVVGTVLGMPYNVRNGIANSVGVGKALYQILT